jgi:hypothetical protein
MWDYIVAVGFPPPPTRPATPDLAIVDDFDTWIVTDTDLLYGEWRELVRLGTQARREGRSIALQLDDAWMLVYEPRINKWAKVRRRRKNTLLGGPR